MPATKTAPKSKKTKKPAAKAAKAKKPAKKPAAPKDALLKNARVILYVSDFDRALAFYTGTLGLKTAYPAEHGWAEFVTGDSAVCIHSGREFQGPTKGVTSVGFSVADFDAAFARLQSKGVTMSKPFMPCGDLRVSHFSDPDGNELSIEGK
jgi:predicted enzyme related to lactoylglutathione lyase